MSILAFQLDWWDNLIEIRIYLKFYVSVIIRIRRRFMAKNKSGIDQSKEATKIRRQLNRTRRRKNRQILNLTKDDSKIASLKNTSGWLTW